jgi:hypothetical protein
MTDSCKDGQPIEASACLRPVTEHLQDAIGGGDFGERGVFLDIYGLENTVTTRAKSKKAPEVRSFPEAVSATACLVAS